MVASRLGRDRNGGEWKMLRDGRDKRHEAAGRPVVAGKYLNQSELGGHLFRLRRRLP